ncbi:MAG: alpha/beta fold hydrolase [Gordonia sp. (in: high G+C Gram-positive bacteria)]|uniref:alpha/beta hydrolase n=1 Tax=Gordonia sp. (in: high G+C Gram-positive bacteria) TaxID=84139 RepID=UPI0039E51533
MTPAPLRHDVRLPRDSHELGAWHYPPTSEVLRDSSGRAPAVVLGHGYGFTRDSGLARYAERFAAAGLHAVVFDYSGFGDSGGGPREVVRIDAQRRDFACALAATRALPDVDPSRVALWGTSYSGGVVIAAAADDGAVAAVVAQVPNLDNLATARFLVRTTPPTMLAWLSLVVSHDVVRGLLRRDPYCVRAVGRTGERAAYVSDESWAQVAQLAGPSWRNRIGMRDFAALPVFRAVSFLDRLPCRVHLTAADHDDLTPVRPTLDAAARLGGRAELQRFPTGHFGVYLPPFFDDVVAGQTDFLRRELHPG